MLFFFKFLTGMSRYARCSAVQNVRARLSTTRLALNQQYPQAKRACTRARVHTARHALH